MMQSNCIYFWISQ